MKEEKKVSKEVKDGYKKIRQIEADIVLSKQVVSTHTKEIQRLNKELIKANEELKLAHRMSADTQISDHALIRYIERCYNLDLDDIRKAILPDTIKQKVKELGNGKFISDGFTVIVKDNKVVTVYDDSDKKE